MIMISFLFSFDFTISFQLIAIIKENKNCCRKYN